MSDEDGSGSAGRPAARRRRILVGAGATVAVVLLVVVGYAAAQPGDEVVALCVDDATGEIAPDENCVTPASSAGGPYPIFIGSGGGQYRYQYGGAGAVGQTVSGGTAAVPREGTRVSTPSGRDISPQHPVGPGQRVQTTEAPPGGSS